MKFLWRTSSHCHTWWSLSGGFLLWRKGEGGGNLHRIQCFPSFFSCFFLEVGRFWGNYLSFAWEPSQAYSHHLNNLAMGWTTPNQAVWFNIEWVWGLSLVRHTMILGILYKYHTKYWNLCEYLPKLIFFCIPSQNTFCMNTFTIMIQLTSLPKAYLLKLKITYYYEIILLPLKQVIG